MYLFAFRHSAKAGKCNKDKLSPYSNLMNALFFREATFSYDRWKNILFRTLVRTETDNLDTHLLLLSHFHKVNPIC